MARRSTPSPSPATGSTTCRSASERWTTGCGPWSCPYGAPRSWCATFITRSARSTSRRDRRAWLTSSSTCSSRGPSDFPRGRSTAWCCSPAGNPTPRPPRTARTTGSRFLATAGSWRWRSRPTGCAGRGSTRRGRGRAPGHRRGAGPRAQFAPGPARPDPSGGHLPSSSLSQPDPGLARRHRADQRRRPASVLPGTLPARRRRPGRRRRRRTRGGPGPDRQPLRAMCRRASLRGRGRRSSSRARPAGAISSLADSESVARGLLGWRTVPRAHPDAPILDVLADLLCGGRRSRLWQSLVETDKVATWVETAHAAAQRAGQFFLQLEAAPDADIAAIEQRIATSCSELARNGPDARRAGPVTAPAQGGLALGTGRSDEPGRRPGLGRALARLASLAGRAAARPDRRSRTTSSESWQTYLIDANLTVGWSLPGPAGRLAVAAAIPPRSRRSAVGRRSLVPSPLIEVVRGRRRRRAWHRSRPDRADPLADDRRDLAARRLQPAARWCSTTACD